MKKDCEQVMSTHAYSCVPITWDFGTNAKKKQWTKKRIFSIFTVNGTVRLKLKQDGPYNSITHLDYLKSLFPENFTMSSL